jgi:hypothetical protein
MYSTAFDVAAPARDPDVGDVLNPNRATNRGRSFRNLCAKRRSDSAPVELDLLSLIKGFYKQRPELIGI